MTRGSHLATRVNAFRLAIFGIFLIVSGIATCASSSRIRFAPKFFEGETLRYQIEMRTVSTGNTRTPIANPEGSTKLSQTISLRVRLDVIGAAGNGAPAAGQSRLRATFEKSQAHSESDAFDPGTPSLEDRYAKIETRSVEFTLLPDGHLANITGIEDVFANRSESDPILSWVQAVSMGGRVPAGGIAVGQKWSQERPLTGFPLSGLSWHTQSTYLRDDRCTPPGATIDRPGDHSGDRPGDPSSSAVNCAILLTHFEIVHHGSAEADSTPDEYRRDGLRTSGTWTGSGESLDAISLATGLLESSTQTSTQNMDYLITSSRTGSRIHHTGQVQSQSEIRLVSGPSSQP